MSSLCLLNAPDRRSLNYSPRHTYFELCRTGCPTSGPIPYCRPRSKTGQRSAWDLAVADCSTTNLNLRRRRRTRKGLKSLGSVLRLVSWALIDDYRGGQITTTDTALVGELLHYREIYSLQSAVGVLAKLPLTL